MNDHRPLMAVKVGDVVCDCRYQHLKVVAITPEPEMRDADLELEDGTHCSLRHCVDRPDHYYKHPAWHRDEHGEVVFG